MGKNRKKGEHKKHASFSQARYLSQAKVALIKSPSPARDLSRIRAQLPAKLYPDIFAWLQKAPSLCERTISNPYPSSPDKWKIYPVPAVIDPPKEFEWCSAYLMQHLQKIAIFIERSKAYEDAFLCSQHEKCAHILQSVQEDFGLSFWLVKRRLAYLQVTAGLETQKKYAGELRENARSAFIQYLTHFLSYRTELTVSPSRFEKNYRRSLELPTISGLLEAYLCHHIVPGPVKDVDSITAILRFDSNGSVIDYYEAFVAAAKMIVAGQHKDMFGVTAAICNKFLSVVQDYRLKRLLYAFGYIYREQVLPREMDRRLFAMFLRGAYADAYRAGITSLTNEPASANTIRLLAMCNALPGSDSADNCAPTHIALAALTNLLRDDSTSEDARSELIRLGWVLDGSPCSHMIRAILRWESTATPLLPAVPNNQYDYIGLDHLDPFQLLWESPDQSYIGAEETISPDATDWTTSLLLLRDGDYETALIHASNLSKSSHPFYRRVAIRTTTFCLQQLGRHKEHIEAIVNIYLENHSTINILPIAAEMQSLSADTRNNLSCQLAYPIFCNIYVSLAGPSVQHMTVYASEDYLMSIGLKRPSQVRSLRNSVDKKQLIYFLREICTEQVMDTWVEFKSSTDVAKERVAICQLLIELDPGNIDLYQGEIKDIIRRLTIKSKLREIEQSKIFVDTESIRNAAKTDLKESYTRYQSFLQSGILSDGIVARDRAKKGFADGDIETILSLAVPSDEMTELLKSMIIQLRDEYLSSSQHGLEGYLSVRVRHGTLVGQLRAPLSSEHLLTQKDFKTKHYKPNEFWVTELALFSNEDKKSLLKAFAEFSDAFEAFVEKVRSEWLQIKKDPDGKGLFDFTLHMVEIHYLSTVIEADTSFEAFIGKVLDYFLTEKLEPSLKNIRNKLQNDAKALINELLLKLHADVDSVIMSESIWKLRDAIGRSRTGMQVTLNRIIEWFNLMPESKREPFSVEDAINISAMSIQAQCREFRSEQFLSEAIKEVLIQGNLASFVDIIFLIFENIVRHSGFSAPAARVTANYNGDHILMRIENDIHPDAVTETIRNNIDATRKAVKQQPYSKSVNKEGGTGFYKLQKILHHDFRIPSCKAEPCFDFGFIGATGFFVEVQIPIHSVKRVEDQ